MISLDVHVLVMPDTPAEWVEQRRATLSEAAAEAGFPVYIHETPGVPGHIGEGRAAGFALGTAPYVTFVDDDDYVAPLAFESLGPSLRAGKDAVFTLEWTVFPDGRLLAGNSFQHHLNVYRRELTQLVEWGRFTWAGERALNILATRRDYACVPEQTYFRRASARSRPLRAAAPNELRDQFFRRQRGR